MLITERHILKSLQHAADELPDPIGLRDSRFVIQATSAAMNALADAEEPINKTHLCHERAKRITEDLQAFIQYRRQEQWCADSIYDYTSYEHRAIEKRVNQA